MGDFCSMATIKGEACGGGEEEEEERSIIHGGTSK
jgi:hypothetical protein